MAKQPPDEIPLTEIVSGNTGSSGKLTIAALLKGRIRREKKGMLVCEAITYCSCLSTVTDKKVYTYVYILCVPFLLVIEVHQNCLHWGKGNHPKK